MRGDKEITNSEDIIDSRDVIDRIEYLQDAKDSLQSDYDDAKAALDEADEETLQDTDENRKLTEALDQAEADLSAFDTSYEGEELKALTELQDEAEGYSSDWKYGATLIRDTYFEDYAQQLAEEIGAINKAASWPNTCIDWKQAAEELQQDYSTVSFDGQDYWIR